MTSLSFQGNKNSYLEIPQPNDFNFGTGDFTIEWYQYQTDNNSFPRIFQVGSYADQETYFESPTPKPISIGVSIEKGYIEGEIEVGSFYFWINGNSNYVNYMETADYKNKWVHFAICREGVILQIFKDGVYFGAIEDGTDFNNTEYSLTIGGESDHLEDNSAFGGYLTYFSWVRGVARYTSDFTVSNDYPPITPEQLLLLKASDFGGTLGSSVVNQNVSTTPNVPPGFLQNTPVANPVAKMFKSMFTNNAAVYYKPNSLASCGVGTVRNSSIKARKT